MDRTKAAQNSGWIYAFTLMNSRIFRAPAAPARQIPRPRQFVVERQQAFGDGQGLIETMGVEQPGAFVFQGEGVVRLKSDGPAEALHGVRKPALLDQTIPLGLKRFGVGCHRCLFGGLSFRFDFFG